MDDKPKFALRRPLSPDIEQKFDPGKERPIRSLSGKIALGLPRLDWKEMKPLKTENS